LDLFALLFSGRVCPFSGFALLLMQYLGYDERIEILERVQFRHVRVQRITQ
jgi:hypothetical protein